MHPSIVYTGTWSLYSGSGPYSDTLHYSDTTGDSAQVKFSGSSIKLVYAANVNNGPVNLAIDGGAPTSLNEYSSSLQWQQQWSSGTLPMGTHTLVLTVTSGTRVNVDAFIVAATAPPTSTNTPTATNTASPTNTPVLPPSSVCVLAYFDWNVNGTRDLTEPVLAGARITVTGPGGSSVGSLITNGTEPRCFSSLPAGNYTVLEENPAGFADTTAGTVTAPVTTTATTIVTFGDSISRPNGIVSDASRNHLFVASKNTNTVVVLDELTQRVLTTVGVESQPLGLGLVNDRVFVANSRSATVTVIDAASLTKMGTVSLNGHCEGGPMYVAVNPLTKRAYAGLYGVGRVAVIDATTNTLADCLIAGLGTFGVAVNSSLGQLYATNRDDMSLQVYDIAAPPNHLIQTFRVGAVPFFVAANAGSSEVYSTVAFDSPDYAIPSTLEIFNANSSGVALKTTRVISNTDDGGAVWFSPTNNKVYVAATHDNELLVLDPTSYAVLQTIPMTDPFYIAENPGLGRIYVTNRNANAITIH
jgi:YVTN family beta-propeller protein